MAWNLKSTEGRIISEINITPLTDVMLVLLVIFMVTTPLIMNESFKIKLPTAATGTMEAGTGITVTVNRAGEIELNGTEVSMETLRASLVTELAERTDKTVLLRADGETLHEVVVEVLDIAKEAGAAKLSIATEPGGVTGGRAR
ncbi:MAG: biopolymer transporter ExbD [Proteobacteria bacterium]|nr:biopolymer transporter ExbD [Pseudomonadota bacterium]